MIFFLNLLPLYKHYLERIKNSYFEFVVASSAYASIVIS